MRRFPVVIFFFQFAAWGILLGQESQSSDEPEVQFHYEDWQDYRVGAGDTLEIQVVNVPQLSQIVEVAANGEITLHPVGGIKALDLTALELEAAVGSVLQEKGLVRDPQVLVFVRGYRARRIWVSGELAFPGEFTISRNLSVLDAILLSGGLTALADQYAYVHRRTSGRAVAAPPTENLLENPDTPREGVNIYKIDLQPVKEGRTPIPDLALEPGDYVVVPRRKLEFYFVMGEVYRPLNYMLPSGRTLRVSQAISTAGGPMPTAKTSEGMLVRTDETGARREYKVDFKAILLGKQEDMVVKANDVIFIPGSIIKTIGEGYIRAANAMISQTAFRIGRTYQLPDRPDYESGP